MNIPLTKGLVARVDAEDFEWLSQFKWQTSGDAKRGIYASRRSEGVTTLMHREILGLIKGDKRLGDHINGNTLDNRRSNLRIVTHAQNSWNCRKPNDNKSGFKGVHRCPRTGHWVAQIRYGGKLFHLGQFVDIAEAYAAYCAASKEHHGEFGRLA